jgi:hypothetical protein
VGVRGGSEGLEAEGKSGKLSDLVDVDVSFRGVETGVVDLDIGVEVGRELKAAC